MCVCVCVYVCVCVCVEAGGLARNGVSGEEGGTDFSNGAHVRVKEEGFQERKASLELQNKSLEALSLVHIIIPKILFRHLRLLPSFLSYIPSHHMR